MTKKEMILNALETVNAKEVNGVFELTSEQLLELDVELGNDGFEYSLCVNKKNDSLKAIYDKSKKNRYAIIKVVEKKKAKVKTKTKRTSHNVKEKNNFYVIKYIVDGKLKVNNKINSCAEIKEFIKSLKGCKVEKLEIYKMGENYNSNKEDIIPTRLSAWR